MGFFDRFRKKSDDLGLDNFDPGIDSVNHDPLVSSSPDHPEGLDFNNPDINQVTGTPKPASFNDSLAEHDSSFNQPQSPSNQPVQSSVVSNNPSGFNPSPTPSSSADLFAKDLQLIIAKLDAIKSELDSLHQRVQKIERIADAEQKRSRYGQW